MSVIIIAEIHYKQFLFLHFEVYYLFLRTIASCVICKTCKNDIQFARTNNRGLRFKIVTKCKYGVKFKDSCPLNDNGFHVNRKIIILLQLSKLERGRINLVYGSIDISQGLPIKMYSNCLKHLHIASSAVNKRVISRAAEENSLKNVKRMNE